MCIHYCMSTIYNYITSFYTPYTLEKIPEEETVHCHKDENDEISSCADFTVKIHPRDDLKRKINQHLDLAEIADLKLQVKKLKKANEHLIMATRAPDTIYRAIDALVISLLESNVLDTRPKQQKVNTALNNIKSLLDKGHPPRSAINEIMINGVQHNILSYYEQLLETDPEASFLSEQMAPIHFKVLLQSYRMLQNHDTLASSFLRRSGLSVEWKEKETEFFDSIDEVLKIE